MSTEPTPPTVARVVNIQLRIALGCILCTVLGGVITVLHYVAPVSLGLDDAGLAMTKVRPLHTTFASAWIFAACLAVIYQFLGTTHGGLTRGDLLRFKFHTWIWLFAGVGIVTTIFYGVFSGREYLGFHWSFSVMLLVGWLAFAFTFLRRLKHGFWAQPVYIYFWTIGTLYFIYTFVEGHAHYFVPLLQTQPTHDLAVQWKSCGTLVGSFNFLVYGCLLFVGERLSGDRSYAQSPIAFWLFGVGCLNSFTNFAHHTYHIPQDSTVKWIAFVVSMLEAIIFLRLVWDITKMMVNRGRAIDATLGYMFGVKWWSMMMIGTGILISVPPLNSFIHGTHVVVGHAMGTELGIDTLVLFASITYLLRINSRSDPQVIAKLNRGARPHNIALNVAMALLVGWLTVAGTVHGITRYYNEETPKWVTQGTKYTFPILGGLLALLLLHLTVKWMRLTFAIAPKRDERSVAEASRLPDGPLGDEPA